MAAAPTSPPGIAALEDDQHGIDMWATRHIDTGERAIYIERISIIADHSRVDPDGRSGGQIEGPKTKESQTHRMYGGVPPVKAREAGSTTTSTCAIERNPI